MDIEVSFHLTKITRPKIRDGIERTRLLEVLEKFRQLPLVLVISNAGAGKTNLAVEFTGRLNTKVAWYSLDTSDRDLFQFGSYLVEALRQVLPGFGETDKGYKFPTTLKETRPNLVKGVDIPDPLVERLADNLLYDLNLFISLQNQPDPTQTKPDAGAPQFWLVLDDYQFAQSTSLNRLIQRLVRLLPAEMHLLLLSRELPIDFPFAEFIVQGRAQVLGVDQLRFSLEEVEQLVSRRYVKENAAGDASKLAVSAVSHHLYNITQGWAVALTLILLSLDQARPKEEYRNLSLAQTFDKWLVNLKNPLNSVSPVGMLPSHEIVNEPLFNYLASTLFNQQPPQRQLFLLKTSVLNVLSPAICDRLMDEPGASQRHLLALAQQQLFVTLLEGEQVFYQYHILIKTFLQHQLSTQPDLYTQTYTQAAAISEEAGRSVEAIEFYLKAWAYPPAASLLDSTGLELFNQGKVRALTDFIKSIPLDLIQKRPNLLQIKALMLQEAGNFEEARTFFLQTARLYKELEDFDRAAKAQADATSTLLLRDAYSTAYEEAKELLTYKSSTNSTPAIAALSNTYYTLGVVDLRAGQFSSAEKWFEKAQKLYQELGDQQRFNTTLSGRASVYVAAGKLVKARSILHRTLLFWQRTGNLAREVYVHHLLASILRCSGKFAEGIEAFEENLVKFGQVGVSYLKPYTLHELGDCYRDTANYEQAELNYKLARQEAQGNIPLLEVEILASWGLNYWLQAKPVPALELFEEGLELAYQNELPQKAADVKINLALAEISRQRYAIARDYLREILELLKQFPNPPLESRAVFQLAIALFGLNEKEQACQTLLQSLALVSTFLSDNYLPYELEQARPLLTFASLNLPSLPVEPSQVYLLPDFLERLRQSGRIIEQAPGPAAKQEAPSKPAAPAAQSAGAGLAQTQANILPVLDLKALNGGQIFVNGQEVTRWKQPKIRWLLFFLVEHPGATIDKIQTELWSEGSEIKPGTVYALFSDLRKVISPVTIKVRNGGYTLPAGSYRYDVLEFERSAKALLTQHTQASVADFEKVLELHPKEYLAELAAFWAEEKRRHLTDLYVECAILAGQQYHKQGQYRLAISAWRRVLQYDKYYDEAYLTIIASYRALGLEGEARRQQKEYDQVQQELENTDET